ncbi:L,D-transpeptidase [Pendulispora brunnea]|uniref:L,D-transpeptidase n=1 Tax=Pendulispora brunnea TaxID=2905690 RepID=A0ABZ2K3T3_9BACT
MSVVSFGSARFSKAAVLVGASLFWETGCRGHANDAQPANEADGSAEGTVVPMPVAADAGPPGSPPPTPKVGAIVSPAPVFSATEFPPRDPNKASEERQGVFRLGYLRKGAVVEVKPQIIKKGNCAEGWYELVMGGFICGKYVTADMSNKELANAAHTPYADGPLPYEYGLNLTNGTPLFRRAPSRKERTDAERGLAIGKTKRGPDGKALPTPEAAAMAASGQDTPWYLKSHNGGRPQVTFEELKGETGLIVWRMVRGFYLSLDKEVKLPAGKMWRTTDGYFAPTDHLLVHKPTTEFEGVWVGHDDEKRKLPLGFITHPRAWRYQYDEAEKKVRRNENVPRFTIVQLTGKKVIVEERAYYETTDGYWMKDLDGQPVMASAPPSDLAKGEKWIDINLKTQSLVAYEGDKPVYATIVSTGRHNDEDKSQDHRTPMGSYRIREKHTSATMDDDATSEGPYSIQDVPWIMYFHGSYALHGAFWHSSFGHERSHGCVNMTPHDAKNIFEWAGPSLPKGWHGVRATDKNPGARVIVHE